MKLLELKKRIQAKPEEYMDSVEGASALAQKMLAKVKAGSGVSLNCNPALKAACAKMQITSYKSLVEYLNGFGCVA